MTARFGDLVGKALAGRCRDFVLDGFAAAANGDVAQTRDDASAKQLVTWDSFEATCFPTRVKAALTSAGFTSPSEIQKRAWPPACEGRDVVAVAKTGSGKTLAFLLPSAARSSSCRLAPCMQ